MLIVNIFAGPSAGKTTYAAGLFYKLKQLGVSCEFIPEYAKELVWEGNSKILENQGLVFAGQLQRILRLENSVDVAITDSPLDLSLFYKTEDYPRSFDDFVVDVCDRFATLDIFLKRDPDESYDEVGRIHTEEEALALDEEILEYLQASKQDYLEAERDSFGEVLEEIFRRLNDES